MKVDHELAVKVAQKAYDEGHISRERLEAFKVSHPCEETRRIIDEVEEAWTR